MIKSLFDAKWKRILIAAAIFFIITVIHTFPLITQLTTHIPGYGGDINYYYWAHWWFDEAIDRGTKVWNTDMLWYPNGTSLVFSTNRFGSSAFGFLLTPITGQIASYNLIIMLSYVISALGVYVLANVLVRNELAAYLAAYVFAFNPFKMHALMHHHFLLSTYVFGFSVYLLWRLLNEEGLHIWKAVGLGVLFALTFYESLFLSVFLFLTLLTVFIVYAIVHWRTAWKGKKLAAYGIVLVVALLLMISQIDNILDDLHQYGGLPQAGGVDIYCNDLLHLAWPSPLLLSAPGQHTGEFFVEANHTYRTAEENFGMPGWFALAGAIAGWWMNRRKLFANIALGGMLFFFLMSLGSKLWIGGSMTGIPSIYALFQWIPFISMIRTPSRFVLIGFLFLGILLAYAVASLWKNRKEMFRWVAIGLAVLIFFDYLPLGVDTQDQYDVPQPVKDLRAVQLKESDPGAVVHLNIDYRDNMRYVAFHEKPMTSGYTARTTLFSRPLQDFSVALAYGMAWHVSEFPDSDMVEACAENMRKIFRHWGIGFILYRESPEKVASLAAALSATVVSSSETMGLIKLPPQELDQYSLTLTPKSLPKMDYVGLGSGEFSSWLWSYGAGFSLAIPDSLMPSGTISLSISSPLRSPDRAAHSLIVFCNREAIGKIEVGNRVGTYEVAVPDTVERLPVNILAFRNLITFVRKSDRYPFVAEISSANKVSGGMAGLVVDGTELLQFKHYGRMLHLASSTDGKTFTVQSIDMEKKVGNRVKTAIEGLKEARYLICFGSGNLRPIAMRNLITSLKEYRIHLTKRQMSHRSFIIIADLKKGTYKDWQDEDNILTVFVNREEISNTLPALNIKEITLR